MRPDTNNPIEHAHAISVHKAQGSQWPLVIVPIYRSRILDRSLIYTAATSASEQIVFVGCCSALNFGPTGSL